MTWHSIHIFYQKEQDDFLVQCIEPLAQSLKKDKLITQLFFLRYWKQGPHIRLRFFVPEGKYNSQVPDMVCDQITNYLTQHPSSSEIDEELYKEVQERYSMLEQEELTDLELVPNNTWRIEQYKPEYTKYGGSRGVAIAEEFFDRSTTCAFLLLSEMRDVPTRRLGIGFIMMLLGVSQFDIPVEEMPAFFNRYHRFWSRYIVGETTSMWEKKLKEHWDSLYKSARTVLSQKRLPQPAFEMWRDTMRHTSELLYASADEVLEAVTLAGPDMPKQQRREFLLFNYLHTHNNRLGNYPGDEAYLAFLGEQIVKSIIK